MRVWWPAAVLLIVLFPAGQPAAEPAWQPNETWTIRDEPWVDKAGTIHPTVDAFLAYPVSADTLVVMAHGYTHNATGSWWPHMERVVAHGAAALAMDFRDNNGFPTLRGAEDMNDATHAAIGRLAELGHTIDRVIALGVSMGGAISGNAVATSDAYDVWMNVEGVTQLYESYLEGSAALPAVARAMERDIGCTFQDCPQRYLDASPAHRADEMVGLDAVYTIHALYDGLVPYDQGAQMVAALDAAGVNQRFTTVLRGEEGTDQDTTPGSHGIGAENPVEQLHGLSGHGTESDYDQVVINTAFNQLWALLAGEAYPVGTETAVEDRRL